MKIKTNLLQKQVKSQFCKLGFRTKFIFLHLGSETESSVLHHISILSGPIFALLAGSFLCLVPIHNVMEQPQYWYEDQFCRAMALVPLMISKNLLRAEYWSNFTFKNKWVSFLILAVVGITTYTGIIIGYYILWVEYQGLSLPLPMNLQLAGSIASIMINITLFFR